MPNYKYALVLVNVANLGTRTFSYLIPDEFKSTIKIGQPVLVSFGNQGVINAFVVGFSDYLPENIKAKSILEIIDTTPLFDLDYLKLLEWVSNYYCCDLQTVLSCAIPMKFLTKTKRIVKLLNPNFCVNSSNEKALLQKISQKPINASSLQKFLKLTPSKFYALIRKLKSQNYISIENVLDEKTQKTIKEKYLIFKHKNNAQKRQLEVLDKLEQLKEVKLISFEKEFKFSRQRIKKLESEGFLEIQERPIYRNPLNIFAPKEIEKFPKLSQEQQNALNEILKRQKSNQPIYLYGVTGSGKTEIYFNLIKKVLNEGKNIMFLAPEIALASQLTQRLAKRFGIDTTAIWHSSISDGERYDVWQKHWVKEEKEIETW